MKRHSPREIQLNASGGERDRGLLRLLRPLALSAVVAGAAGSLAFMLSAGRRTPRLLLLLFVVWVLSPFVALAWANLVSMRWSVLTRAALHVVTFVIALISLAYYEEVLTPPAGSAPAFVFVAVPPASWAGLAIVVPIAAWISRRRSHQGGVP